MTDPPAVGPAPELLTRVATTRALQEQIAAVHDQAIRDAKAAGHPVTRTMYIGCRNNSGAASSPLSPATALAPDPPPRSLSTDVPLRSANAPTSSVSVSPGPP